MLSVDIEGLQLEFHLPSPQKVKRTAGISNRMHKESFVFY